jgi:hypothetical protein
MDQGGGILATRSFHAVLAFVGVMVAMSLAAHAQRLASPSSPTASSALAGVPALFRDKLHSGLFLEAFVNTELATLRRADIARDGLDEQDVLLSEEWAIANDRSALISAALALDLKQKRNDHHAGQDDQDQEPERSVLRNHW